MIIVDADPLFRRHLAHVLQLAGFSVRLAADGPALRAALDQRQPDVVLIDVVLRHESGLDLCRELRSGRGAADLVVIITSAVKSSPVSTRVDEVSALAAGANDFLPKGLSSEPLVQAIRHALGKAEQGRSSLAS